MCIKYLYNIQEYIQKTYIKCFLKININKNITNIK